METGEFGKPIIMESPTAAGGTPRRSPDKVEGVDGEKWSKWLIPGGKSEFQGIKSSELKVHIRSLARRDDALTPVEKLSEYYDDLEKLEAQLKRPSEKHQVLDYMDRIARRAHELALRQAAGIPFGATTEKKAAFRELPLYIGAVFAGGRNEVLVEDHEKIPTLDVTSEKDRNRFIIENIRAFDYLFKNASSWKGAVDLWIQDFQVANMSAHLSPETVEKFEKDLKAMVAVTASARCMEESAGVAGNYLKTLVGGDEKGKPQLDAADLWKTYLLHGDPEKLNIALKNPLVKKYYDRLMTDAGLQRGPGSEWRQIPDPEHPDQKKDIINEVKLRAGIVPRRFRETSRLVGYLKNGAENGGLQKYIEEVLLKEDVSGLGVGHLNKDARMTAARIACDVFLVDKWTRWENLVTEGNFKVGKGLKLQPRPEWGGDPLRSIIQPTFLPRLKSVYTEKDEVILDLLDSALKPDDIFDKVHRDARRNEDTTGVHPLVPSMAEGLKAYSRLSEATSTVFGGSMATGIPKWDRETMEKGLPDIADLLTQVYGGMEVRNMTTNRKTKIGKEVVGAMMMKILYAKSLATAVESATPGFRENMQIVFDPQNRNRPFLEVMQYLYGLNLDAKSGFVQSLTGGRTRLVIKGNNYDAEKYYYELWKVLNTNDQGGGGKATLLNSLGLALDIAKSFAKNTGIVKSK